jgi:hypothetical protein
MALCDGNNDGDFLNTFTYSFYLCFMHQVVSFPLLFN